MMDLTVYDGHDDEQRTYEDVSYFETNNDGIWIEFDGDRDAVDLPDATVYGGDA